MSRATLKAIQAAAGAGGDTGDDDFANVVLLLDGDGTNGAQNNTFTDSSTNGYTVTETGSVVQGSFSPYGDNWSVYFDGSSYLDTASGATALGTGAFTVEFWINTTATGFNIMNPDSSTGNGYWGLMVQSGDLRWNNQYALTNLWVVDGAPILDGNWHHVAVVSSSSVFTVFYDGVSQSIQSGSFTDPYNYPSSDGLRIGSGNIGAFKGYLSNIRLVSGTAIYSSDFDPPTAPFTNNGSYTEKLLACQSNRFIDNGDSEYAITTSGTPKVTPFSPFKDSDARTLTADGGSGYLANANYLDVGSTSDFTFGTGDFTVEAWVYITDGSQSFGIFSVGGASTGAFALYWIRNTHSTNPKRFQAARYGDAAGAGTTTNQYDINQWLHIRAIRSSGTLKVFINGVEDVGASYAMGNCSQTNIAEVGRIFEGSGTSTTGYIADLRVEVGTATSTSNFTPPTSPVSTTANTDLLLNFQDAGIYDRSGINNLDTVGNAQIDTAVVKYGTGSIEFDGSGDGLSSPETTSFGFGSGDFTIEAWAYLTTNGVFNNIVSAGVDSSNGYRLDISTSNNLRFLAYIGSWATIITGSTSLATGQWYHLAVTRNGNNFDLWVDGSSDATTVSNSGTITEPTTKIEVGAVTTNSLNRSFNGYLDDVRVTKGIARYTANFTPPTAALPKF